jgi:glycosyltransferase involved in cell wall biosynthesis
MNNLKLLHILNEINFSGAEVMLNLAAPLFKQNGIELHALSTGNNRGNYAEVLVKAGYKIHHIPFSKTPQYFYRLYKLLRKEKFDIVHIHPERAFIWHALLAKLAGAKLIVRTVHSIFNFKGILRIKKYIARWFARTILKVKFHSISDSVELFEKQNFSNPTKKIYNWTDESKFYPLTSTDEKKKIRQQIGIREGRFVIISVGSCSPVKRHDVIIKALKTLTEKEQNIIYLHLGSGELLNEEIQLAERIGVKDYIIFAGQKENVRDYLVASDAFVMVSKYEGLTIAGMEAVFCGLPLLVYDTYGLRDVVIDGYNGILLKDLNELDKKNIRTLQFSKIKKNIF